MSSDWQKYLNADPIKWLLEEDNPSVRYFTLRDLLRSRKIDTQMTLAKEKIMEKGIVPKILSKQKRGGYWEEAEHFYIRNKYKGTVWQFIILAELGADGKDKRIIDSCEYLLDFSQDRQSGGFSYRGSRKNGGYHSGVLPCLTGNMIWSLITFGYLDDERIKKGLRWLTEHLRFDDGIEKSPEGWPYDRFEQCWGKHTCHMAVVKPLKAMAEIPPEKRTEDINNSIACCVEYLLKHHLYKRSHDLNRVAKLKWLKLGFPSMWDTDVLEMLGILGKLDYKDARMQEAIDLVLSKQDENGRWPLEHTYNGRFQVNIERKDKPSKWITLNALKALKKFFE
jgi:hypothetical protein